VVFAGVLVTAVLAVASASASRYLQVGLFDEAQLRYGPTDATVGQFQQLHVQVARLTLYWGGPLGVAKRRPGHPGNPDDPAYDWSTYDSIVEQLHAAGIQPLLGILGTPPWANKAKGLNVAPANASDLRAFAYAAALRYSGTFISDGQKLPAVHDWLAWNEPNNPVFLKPQYVKTQNRRAGSPWVIASARAYAQICNAIYSGVHAGGPASDRVACGATAPRGNNDPQSARPSVSPIAFLTAAKAAGLKTFDAWAHHPYYSNPSQTPATSNGAHGAVGLGNIDTLIQLVTKLYGNKRIWITEYGYETNPPDPYFGVSWSKQALYLKQAFAIARANPRIDLMTWFLLRDDTNVNGWQSGLETAAGQKKPSYAVFSSLRD
jgi:hypothetical protein